MDLRLAEQVIPFRFTGSYSSLQELEVSLHHKTGHYLDPRKTNKNPKALSLRKPCCLNLDCPTAKVRGGTSVLSTSLHLSLG